MNTGRVLCFFGMFLASGLFGDLNAACGFVSGGANQQYRVSESICSYVSYYGVGNSWVTIDQFSHYVNISQGQGVFGSVGVYWEFDMTQTTPTSFIDVRVLVNGASAFQHSQYTGTYGNNYSYQTSRGVVKPGLFVAGFNNLIQVQIKAPVSPIDLRLRTFTSVTSNQSTSGYAYAHTGCDHRNRYAWHSMGSLAVSLTRPEHLLVSGYAAARPLYFWDDHGSVQGRVKVDGQVVGDIQIDNVWTWNQPHAGLYFSFMVPDVAAGYHDVQVELRPATGATFEFWCGESFVNGFDSSTVRFGEMSEYGLSGASYSTGWTKIYETEWLTGNPFSNRQTISLANLQVDSQYPSSLSVGLMLNYRFENQPDCFPQTVQNNPLGTPEYCEIGWFITKFTEQATYGVNEPTDPYLMMSDGGQNIANARYKLSIWARVHTPSGWIVFKRGLFQRLIFNW